MLTAPFGQDIDPIYSMSKQGLRPVSRCCNCGDVIYEGETVYQSPYSEHELYCDYCMDCVIDMLRMEARLEDDYE